MKIGIFDSGLGGLFLTKAITESLPEYDYMYLGDTKNVPYGNRSRETVYELTRDAVDYLFKKDCMLIILACNTASALALRKLQQEYLIEHYPDRRVLGVLIPIAEVSIEGNPKNIGVLGTRGTVESGAFVDELKKLNSNIEVSQQTAPLLVPLIENDGMRWSNPILEKYLDPLRNSDAVILGCTHYSIIRDRIENLLGENTKIVCQTDVIPGKLRDYLHRHQEIDEKLSKNGRKEFFVTDITDHFQKLANEWFGNSIELRLAKY